MTKEQALECRYGSTEIHFTGKHPCVITIGPRGGYSDNITQCRPSGQCKTWKRNETRFRLPIKHGLYESGEITEDNCEQFHLAEDCPALKAYHSATGENVEPATGKGATVYK